MKKSRGSSDSDDVQPCSKCSAAQSRLFKEGEEALFPDSWKTMDTCPGFGGPAAWTPTEVLRHCGNCGMLWYLSYDPRERVYSSIEALPKSCLPILSARVTHGDIVEFLFAKDCERSVPRVVQWSNLVYLRDGDYRLEEAAEVFLQALERENLTLGTARYLLRLVIEILIRIETARRSAGSRPDTPSGQKLHPPSYKNAFSLCEREDLFAGMDMELKCESRVQLFDLLETVLKNEALDLPGAEREALQVGFGKKNRVRKAIATLTALQSGVADGDAERIIESVMEIKPPARNPHKSFLTESDFDMLKNLQEAFRTLRKEKQPGRDLQIAKGYIEDLTRQINKHKKYRC